MSNQSKAREFFTGAKCLYNKDYDICPQGECRYECVGPIDTVAKSKWHANRRAQRENIEQYVEKLEARIKALREALESLARWDQSVNGSEEEIRYALAVDVPWEAREALKADEES